MSGNKAPKAAISSLLRSGSKQNKKVCRIIKSIYDAREASCKVQESAYSQFNAMENPSESSCAAIYERCISYSHSWI